ncbi:MAG: hypothetical protein ACFB03_17195 [Paracoccaceae bacterium]
MIAPSTPEIRPSLRAGNFSGAAIAARLAPKSSGGRVFLLISIKPFAAPAATMPPDARKDSRSMTKHTKDPPQVEVSKEQTEHAQTRRALFLDTDLYQRYLDSTEYTDEAKRDFVEALWSIMVSFVDLGWGIHPLQQLEEICGQLEDDADLLSQQSDQPLKSECTKAIRGAS